MNKEGSGAGVRAIIDTPDCGTFEDKLVTKQGYGV